MLIVLIISYAALGLITRSAEVQPGQMSGGVMWGWLFGFFFLSFAIAMGTRGRTGLDRVFMGSVAQNVVGSAPCPVLVVPSMTQALEINLTAISNLRMGPARRI